MIRDGLLLWIHLQFGLQSLLPDDGERLALRPDSADVGLFVAVVVLGFEDVVQFRFVLVLKQGLIFLSDGIEIGKYLSHPQI